MNAKKAKALRKHLGLAPSAERIYKKKLDRGTRIVQGADGKPQEATGPRHLYQQVKRGRVTL